MKSNLLSLAKFRGHTLDEMVSPLVEFECCLSLHKLAGEEDSGTPYFHLFYAGFKKIVHARPIQVGGRLSLSRALPWLKVKDLAPLRD